MRALRHRVARDQERLLRGAVTVLRGGARRHGLVDSDLDDAHHSARHVHQLLVRRAAPALDAHHARARVHRHGDDVALHRRGVTVDDHARARGRAARDADLHERRLALDLREARRREPSDVVGVRPCCARRAAVSYSAFASSSLSSFSSAHPSA